MGMAPLPRLKLDAAYYRRRARESRGLAETVPDAAIKKQLQHMADGYDLIAERAEAREKRMPLTLTALL
jgi:hypothetical protein